MYQMCKRSHLNSKHPLNVAQRKARPSLFSIRRKQFVSQGLVPGITGLTSHVEKKNILTSGKAGCKYN